jgi:type IV secretion system protein VirB10
MMTDGFPPLTGDRSQPSPDPKLDLNQGALRAARPKPARYNGRIAALLAGAAAILVVSAIFAPALMGKSAHPKTPAQTSVNGAPPIPPVDPISYGAGPADPATGASGVDCSQYPGMPGCAGKTAATPTTPAAPAVPAPAGAPAVPPDAATSASQVAQPTPTSAQPGLSGGSPAVATRSSSIFFAGSVGPSAQASAVPQGGPPPPATAQAPMPLPSPITPFQAQKDAGQPSEVMAQNGQGEKAAFVRTAAGRDYVEARLSRPRSPYEIKAGTIIPAALLTAINSDLPGEVIAQVTQPVYDHVTGRYVLIPQGARLIGRYDAQVAYGQSRALVVWHRVIFPNGNSLNFGNMSATDSSGASGVADRVNDHFGQIAKGIALSTLLSMGAASAQDAQARFSGTLVLNAGVSGVANEAESVGSRLVSRDLNRQPTITIRPGARVSVLVDKDMILEPYN